jgi:hypothetical protein
MCLDLESPHMSSPSLVPAFPSAPKNSILTLAKLAEMALKKQQFENLEPNDPLHGLVAFNGVATVCLHCKAPTYTINIPETLESSLSSMEQTLSGWEKARGGFGLKDKGAAIYVIYISSGKVFLRIGFPKMGHMHGEVGPLGGHIDLAAKQPCLAAGQVLFTKTGEKFGVKDIDNQSGHYKPTEVEFGGKLLKTPRTITATTFQLALGVSDIEKIYRDPEDEKRKAEKLKEEKLDEKSANLMKPMPDEEKLLEFCNVVAKDGGLSVIQTRNINPYVQKLANVIARAKYGKQASSYGAAVQAVVKTALQKNDSLKKVVLELVSHYSITTTLRSAWIEVNVKD